MSPVHELTEDPARAYAKDIQAATDLADLRRRLKWGWKGLADDAIACAVHMREEEFAEFREGLLRERRKKYAGDEWAMKYGAILLPELMLRASAVAEQFHVPWGLAFIRVREAKRGGMSKQAT